MSPAKTQVDDPPKRRRGRPPRVSSEEIVAAATHLFARRGYRGTTVVAIAEAVGVKDASVLYHFDSKLDILRAALQDDAVAHRELMAQLDPGGIEALVRLASWGARMESHPETTRLQLVLSSEAMMEGAELHDRYVERYNFLRRSVSNAIQKGIDRGEIRPGVDALQEASGVLAFLDGLRVQWLLADGGVSLDDYFRAYMEQTIDRIAEPSAAQAVGS